MVSAVLSRFCSTAINSWHADAQRAARTSGGNGRIDAGPAVLITLSRCGANPVLRCPNDPVDQHRHALFGVSASGACR